MTNNTPNIEHFNIFLILARFGGQAKHGPYNEFNTLETVQGFLNLQTEL